MSEAAPKIRVRGLRKAFGAKQVLDGIDLDVMAGTSMVVIGGSGTGKSVLLKCILGLMEPDDGTIEIDGRDLLRLPPGERRAARAQIGMLFQNGALFDRCRSGRTWPSACWRSAGASRAEAHARAEEVLAPGRAGADRGRAVAGRIVGRDAEARRRWRAPSPRSRRSCSSTSRPPASIRSWAR